MNYVPNSVLREINRLIMSGKAKNTAEAQRLMKKNHDKWVKVEQSIQLKWI